MNCCNKLFSTMVTFNLLVLISTQQANADQQVTVIPSSEYFFSNCSSGLDPEICQSIEVRHKICLPHLPKRVNGSDDLKYCQYIRDEVLPNRRKELYQSIERVQADRQQLQEKLANEMIRLRSCLDTNKKKAYECNERAYRVRSILRMMERMSYIGICLDENYRRIDEAEAEVCKLIDGANSIMLEHGPRLKNGA